MTIDYDEVISPVRAVQARQGNFCIVFTCNLNLKHCTVQIRGTGPLTPEIQYVGREFILTFDHLTLRQEDMAEFRAALRETEEFCRTAETGIRALRDAIERGEALPGKKDGETDA